jgi:hypothetical protein
MIFNLQPTAIAKGVDVSKDTVTAEKMLEGVTAHDANGQPIAGTIPTYVGCMPEIMSKNDIMVLPTAGKYCAHDINIQPALRDITITENGTFVPSDGFAGFARVIVNIPRANSFASVAGVPSSAINIT